MDETTATALTQLRLAFKSLVKSAEKALMTDMYPGSGDVSARSYRSLHAHAVTLIPDDYYVREVLALDVADDAPEKQKLAAVSLQAGQMVDYLDSLLKVSDPRFAFSSPDLDEIKTLGRDLQEQILSVTRTTLKRALAGIDISITRPPAPPEPPEPPEPPAPPEPPKGKRKIEIEDDEDETDDNLDGMV
ncbi:MAG: hypothetical protein U0452_11480 [Anaerolineae bacterium]